MSKELNNGENVCGIKEVFKRVVEMFKNKEIWYF